MIAQATPQTNWKFILITSGTALGLGILFLKGFWFPLDELKRKEAFVAGEEQKQRTEFLTFMKERNRLERDRLLGMPKNLETGSTEYIKYFREMLTACGLKVEDFQPASLDVRPAGGAGKKAAHVTVTFTARAEGNWPSLVKLLDKFRRTPLLHRLKTCNVEEPKTGAQAATGKLAVNMTIEALMVNGSDKKRPDNLFWVDPKMVVADTWLGMYGQPAGWAMLLRGQALLVPEAPARDYARLAQVDPFMTPAFWTAMEKHKKKLDDEKNRPKTAKGRRPAAEVFLAAIFTSDQGKPPAAGLRVYTDPEKLVTLTCAKGGQAFDIADAYIKGRVLRIEQRDLYIQVGKEIYQVHIGQYLAEAMKRPLSAVRVKQLGLLTGPAANPVEVPVAKPEVERLHIGSPMYP